MSLPSSMADFVPCDRLLQKVRETDYSPRFDAGGLVPTRRDVMKRILQAQNMCSICSRKPALPAT